MEFLFEKTTWDQKFSRMDARIIELQASVKHYSNMKGVTPISDSKSVGKDGS